MQVALPELNSTATLVLDRDHGISDEDYIAFCEANPDLGLERSAQGEIIIVPPAGMESDHRSLTTGYSLFDWALKSGCGKAFGSSVEFFLPDGSALFPDAAWVSNERLASVPREELRRFPHLVPEFIVKVMSPSDRLAAAKRKMDAWMSNGVELGWLIDGDARRVYIFRQGKEMRVLEGAGQVAGEGPVKGFVLKLAAIWKGL